MADWGTLKKLVIRPSFNWPWPNSISYFLWPSVIRSSFRRPFLIQPFLIRPSLSTFFIRSSNFNSGKANFKKSPALSGFSRIWTLISLSSCLLPPKIWTILFPFLSHTHTRTHTHTLTDFGTHAHIQLRKKGESYLSPDKGSSTQIIVSEVNTHLLNFLPFNGHFLLVGREISTKCVPDLD